MSVFYRLLGLVAKGNERMYRYRLNGVPSNFLILIIVGIVLGIAINATYEAAINGSKPMKLPLEQVLDRTDLNTRFVETSGPIVPGASLVYGEEKNGNVGKVEAVYVPMISKAKQKILLVKFKEDITDRPPGVTEVRGMMRRPAPVLTKKLTEMGGKIGPLAVDQKYVLEEGSSPTHVAVAGLGAGVLGLVMVLFAMAIARKNLIFQRTPQNAHVLPDPTTAPAPEGGIGLRVSGRFVLGEKLSQRFLNVPAAMGPIESGELAFVSNIDASKKFMGTVTEKRQGYWAVLARPETIQEPELGRLYLGLSAFPALKLFYTDAVTQKPASAVLSFPNEEHRLAMLNELSKAIGRPLAPV